MNYSDWNLNILIKQNIKNSLSCSDLFNIYSIVDIFGYSVLIIINSSMIDSSLSQSLSETCQNCDKFVVENNKLRKKLATYLESQNEMQVLRKIKKQLEGIQMIAAQYNIDIEDLAGAFSFALDTMFAMRSKPIVEKGKDVIQLIKQLFQHKNHPGKEGFPPQEEAPASASAKPKQTKIAEKPATKAHQSHSDSPTQKVEDKKEVIKLEANSIVITQKQAQSSIFQELNSYRNKEEKAQNPYVPREQTPFERKAFTNSDEQHQKLSKINNSSSFEEVFLPLTWEKRTFFDMSNKTFTKKYNDIYKKICTENPLPRSGKHHIKVEMLVKGTVAFGVVTAAFRNEGMIDDRKCDAVKYLSFDNGGGLVKLCGEELLGGERVHLRPGQSLEIDFNAAIPEVTFRNPNLQKPLEIRLGERFRNKELYFFLEMKHLNTSVRFS